MKRFVTATLAAVALAACFDDPTSSLRNGATSMRLSRNALFIAPGDSVNVTGHLYDEQGNQIPGTLQFASDDAAVAMAGADPSLTQPLDSRSGGYVKGVAAGQTLVRVSGGGVNDSIRVTVVPPVFTGAIAPATTTVGTVVTATMPAALTLDTANALVTVDGVEVEITAKSSTSVSFRPQAASGGVVAISGLVLLNSLNLPPLEASTTLDVTETGEPANDNPGGTANLTMPANVGDTLLVYGSADGTDIDDFYNITPASGDSVTIEVEWLNSGIDIDLLVTNAGVTACLFGCSAATGANPEREEARLVAGTTYRLWVNMYDTHGEPVPVVYVLRIIRRA